MNTWIIPLTISTITLLISVWNIWQKRQVQKAISTIYQQQFARLAERERRLMETRKE